MSEHEEQDAAEERRRKAEEAVHAISQGANPGELSLGLANDFTDAMTERMKGRLRRKRE